MRSHRSDPIAVPLGHIERPHGDRQPLPVLASGEHVDYRLLDVPTVTRRAEQRGLDRAVQATYETLRAVLPEDVAMERARTAVWALVAEGLL